MSRVRRLFCRADFLCLSALLPAQGKGSSGKSPDDICPGHCQSSTSDCLQGCSVLMGQHDVVV